MKTLNLVFEGCVFRFYTDAGVFSRDDLDKGTALLLRYRPTCPARCWTWAAAGARWV